MSSSTSSLSGISGRPSSSSSSSASSSSSSSVSRSRRSSTPLLAPSLVALPSATLNGLKEGLYRELQGVIEATDMVFQLKRVGHSCERFPLSVI
jgi:hypothetical protein